jgi:hypothetical protein
MTETSAEYIVTTSIEGKPWRCPNRHLLGHVWRENNIRRLRLEMHGIIELGERRMIVILTGPADVFCPVCGEMRTWHAGEEAMEDLIRRMRG